VLSSADVALRLMLIAKCEMAVCCQNLTLGALSSRSALSMLVGALFKKFNLFLTIPLFLTLTLKCLCHYLLITVASPFVSTHNVRSIYSRTTIILINWDGELSG
jgi:hypothetical protein